MIPTLSQIEASRECVSRSAIRTPLVRLNVTETPAEIYLKLENLQPIGSFKIRGAANAIRRMSGDQLKKGVLTVTLPKTPEACTPAKKIEVKPGA